MTVYHGSTPPPPSKPEASPESLARVRAAAAALSGYHIGEPPDDALADESKLVHYCMDSNGVVEIRRNMIGFGAVPAKRIAGLATIPCGFQMTIPRIPWVMFAQTVNFFRGVIRRHGGRSLEAAVQIFFSPASGEYSLYVPPQRVTGASVNHEGNGDPNGNLIHVADIHSHGSTMSAFFSGTDDGDEMRFDRCYGVIGNVLDDVPSMKFRARVGSSFVEMKLGELIYMPDEVEIKMPISALMNRGAAPAQVKIDPFAGHDAPEEWYEPVKVEAIAIQTYGGRGRGDHYNHSDAYYHQGSGQRSFRPAWDRDGVAPRQDGGSNYLVSSSGRRYLATAGGIFPIEIGSEVGGHNGCE